MATGVQVLTSEDAGAPVLNGNDGAMAAVLDWALVTKSGWTLAFSSGNKRVYRQKAGAGFYLRVNDGIASFQFSVMGFETMSGVDTGTGQFPSEVGSIDEIKRAKFDAGGGGLSTAARKYRIFVDDRTVHVFHTFRNDVPTKYRPHLMFGDIASRKGADAYACMLICENGDNGNWQGLQAAYQNAAGFSVGDAQSIARSHTGGAGSITRTVGIVEMNLVLDGAKWRDPAADTASNAGRLPRPNPVDKRLYGSPVRICEIATKQVRGYLRGCWQWSHTAASAVQDETFAGGGPKHSGKTFRIVRDIGDAGKFYDKVYVFEVSDTWKTTDPTAPTVSSPLNTILVEHEQPLTALEGPGLISPDCGPPLTPAACLEAEEP